MKMMILKIAFNNSKSKRKTNPKLIIKAMIKKKKKAILSLSRRWKCKVAAYQMMS
jgi:hypothetical protein